MEVLSVWSNDRRRELPLKCNFCDNFSMIHRSLAWISWNLISKSDLEKKVFVDAVA